MRTVQRPGPWFGGLMVLTCFFSGCGAGREKSPTEPVACSQSPDTITFANLKGIPGKRWFLRTYAEGSFIVRPGGAIWLLDEKGYRARPGTRFVRENYIYFNAPNGSTVTASVIVTAAGCPFTFRSLALYSSVTTIPYQFHGKRNGATVFTAADTLPRSGGTWRTVPNPHSEGVIDNLEIRVTNPVTNVLPLGGDNPLGLAHIVLNQ